jgi:hypothetical protein
MNEANLAIARKVILCAGLMVAALLFLFPHWTLSVRLEVAGTTDTFNQEFGRHFIYLPGQKTLGSATFIARVNYVRQFTEVALALLFTFAVMRALKLKKPAGG